LQSKGNILFSFVVSCSFSDDVMLFLRGVSRRIGSTDINFAKRQ